MSDHKAEAERLTTLAAEIDSTAAAMVAVANATLYLAEQQRIANLIGFAEKMGHPANLSTLHPQDQADFVTMIPKIREGLGLA